LTLELARLRERLQRAAGHPVFREPAHLIRMYQQRVDDLRTRLALAMRQGVERARNRLGRANGQLTALNPRNVLRRGYAILLPGDGPAVTAAATVPLGGRLRGVLAEGELELMVTGKRDQS
jgi:exodeoxyribonuclease VII large subunit